MISAEEAYELAYDYAGRSDRVHLHLTDFDLVCVIEFGYEASPRHIPDMVLGDTEADDFDYIDDIEFDDIPAGGYSPILIDKRNGKIFETGSDVLYSPDCYADCYLSSGFVRGEPTATVSVSGIAAEASHEDIVKLITASSILSDAKVKRLLKRGGNFEFEASNANCALDLVRELRGVGVQAIQHWIGDDTPEYFDGEDTDTTTLLDLDSEE